MNKDVPLSKLCLWNRSTVGMSKSESPLHPGVWTQLKSPNAEGIEEVESRVQTSSKPLVLNTLGEKGSQENCSDTI